MSLISTTQRKKLYKAKKMWTTATLFGSAVVLTQVANQQQVTAHADETSSNNSTSSSQDSVNKIKTSGSVVGSSSEVSSSSNESSNTAVSSAQNSASSVVSSNVAQSSQANSGKSRSSTSIVSSVSSVDQNTTNTFSEQDLDNSSSLSVGDTDADWAKVISDNKTVDTDQSGLSDKMSLGQDSPITTQNDTTLTPNYHLSTPLGGQNDIQTIWQDSNGLYHVYYLSNPALRQGGDTSWQEATSTDLVNWTNVDGLSIKDYSQDHSVPWGSVATGSVVTSDGTIAGTNAGDIVAYFSSYNANAISGDSKNSQNIHFGGQSIWAAVSKDNGKTFTPLNNRLPVIANSNDYANFRDSHVTKYNGKWVMYTAEGDKIGTYNSNDGVNWWYAGGTMMNSGAFQNRTGDYGLVECPVIQTMTADDGTTHDVMFFGGNDYVTGHTTGTFYMTGHLDANGVFTKDSDPQVLDGGTDYYGANFGKMNNGQVVTAGWVSNWGYAFDNITSQFGGTTNRMGSMSLVRNLNLIHDTRPDHANSYFLHSEVVSIPSTMTSSGKVSATTETDQTIQNNAIANYEFKSKDGSRLTGTTTIHIGHDDEAVDFYLDFDKGTITSSRWSNLMQSSNDIYKKAFVPSYMGIENRSDVRLAFYTDTNSIEIQNLDTKLNYTVERYSSSNKTTQNVIIYPVTNADLYYSLFIPNSVLNKATDEANQRADDNANKLNDANNKLNDTTNKLNDANNKLNDANNKLNDMQNQLNNANSTNNNNQSVISSLQKQLSDSQNSNSLTQSQVTVLQQKLNEATNANNANLTTISNLQKQLSDTQNAGTLSQSQIQTLQKQLQDAQSSAAASQNQIQDLTNKLNQVTIQKSQSVYNILDYGAKSGDKNFDNAAIINKIIAQLPASGGTIYVPEGDFYLNSSIHIDKNYVRIMGNNSGLRSNIDAESNPAAIHPGGGSRLIVNGQVDSGILVGTAGVSPRISGTEIDHLNLMGANGFGTDHVDQKLINVVQDNDGTKIHDNTMINANYGVIANGADAISIKDNWISELKNGVHLLGSSQQAQVQGNYIGGQPGGISLKFDNPYGASINNNNIYPDGFENIEINNGTMVNVTGNNIQSFYAGAVKMSGNNISFTDNLVYGKQSNGQWLQDPIGRDGKYGLIHLDGDDLMVNNNRITSEQPVNDSRIVIMTGNGTKLVSNSIDGNPSNAKIVVNGNANNVQSIFNIADNEFQNGNNPSNINVTAQNADQNSASIVDMSNRLSKLQSQLIVAQQNATNSQGSADQLTALTNDLKNQLADAQKKLSDSNGTNAALSQQITSLTSQLQQAQNDLSAAQAAKSKADTDLQNSQNQVNALNNQLNQANADKTSLSKAIVDLQNQVKTLTTNGSVGQDTINQLNTKISSLQSQLNNVQNDSNSKDTTISSLKAQIVALQTQISNLSKQNNSDQSTPTTGKPVNDTTSTSGPGTLTSAELAQKYHITTNQGWSNDLQTISWNEQGQYYDIYFLHSVQGQTNVFGDQGQDWEHTTTKDFIHYTTPNTAIESHGGSASYGFQSAWTGSVITNTGNITGVPVGAKVAYFSGLEGGDGSQNIWAAWSDDNGNSYTHMLNNGNPIIDHSWSWASANHGDERDPSVTYWNGKMLMYASEGQEIGVYTSTDGINWQKADTSGASKVVPGTFFAGHNWNGAQAPIECPSIHTMIDSNGNTKTVLFFGAKDGDQNQTTSTYYIVGELNANGLFYPDNGATAQRLDNGTDYYGSNFSTTGSLDKPASSLITMSWAGNWSYTPAPMTIDGNRVKRLGSYTTARTLVLNGDGTISQTPITSGITGDTTNQTVTVGAGTGQNDSNGPVSKMWNSNGDSVASTYTFDLSRIDGQNYSNRTYINVQQGNDFINLNFDANTGAYLVSRQNSTITDAGAKANFEKAYVDYTKIKDPSHLKITMITDANTVEFFFPDGTTYTAARYTGGQTQDVTVNTEDADGVKTKQLAVSHTTVDTSTIVQTNKTVSDMQKEITDLQNQLASSGAALSSANANVSDLTSQLQKLNQALKDTQATGSANADSLRQQVQDVTAKLQQATSDLNAKQSALDAANKALSDANSRAGVSDQNAQAAIDKANQASSDAKTAESAANQAIADKNQAIADKNQAINDKNSAIADKNAAVAAQQAAQAQIDSLTKQLDQVNSDKSSLSSQLQQAQSDLARSQAARDQANNDLQAANGNNKDLQSKLDSANTSLNAANAAVNAIKQQLDAANSAQSSLSDQLKRSQTDLSNANTQLAAANKKAADAQTQANDLQSKLDDANKTISTLQSNVNDLTNQMNSLKTQLDTTNKALNDARASSGNSDSRVNDLVKQVSDLNNQLNALNGTLTDKQNALNTSNQQLADLQTQLQNAKNDSAAKSSQLDQTNQDKQSLQSQLDQANQNATAAQKTIDTLNTQIKQLQDQAASDASNNNATNSTNQDVINGLKKDLAAATSQLVQANQNVTTLNSQLNDKNATISDLTAKLNAANANAQNLANSLQQAKNDSTTLQNELNDANSQKATLSAQVNDLQNQLTASKNESASLRDQITQLNKQRDDAAAQITALQGKLDSASDALAKCKLNGENLQKQLDQANKNAQTGSGSVSGSTTSQSSSNVVSSGATSQSSSSSSQATSSQVSSNTASSKANSSQTVSSQTSSSSTTNNSNVVSSSSSAAQSSASSSVQSNATGTQSGSVASSQALQSVVPTTSNVAKPSTQTKVASQSVVDPTISGTTTNNTIGGTNVVTKSSSNQMTNNTANNQLASTSSVSRSGNKIMFAELALLVSVVSAVTTIKRTNRKQDQA